MIALAIFSTISAYACRTAVVGATGIPGVPVTVMAMVEFGPRDHGEPHRRYISTAEADPSAYQPSASGPKATWWGAPALATVRSSFASSGPLPPKSLISTWNR